MGKGREGSQRVRGGLKRKVRSKGGGGKQRVKAGVLPVVSGGMDSGQYKKRED